MENTIKRKSDNNMGSYLINTLVALCLVKEANKDKGCIECPECKGKLHFVRAKVNGHIAARCETPNCLSFQE